MIQNSNSIALTKEELDSLKSIQEDYSNLIIDLGRVEVDMLNILTYKEKLKQKLKDLQLKESNKINEIKDKYGDGNINLETGQFSPN